MDVFNKVSPGDPLRIKAGTWNAVMDASRAVLAGRPAALGSAMPGVGTPLRDAVTILVRNDSGSDLDPLSVVGLGAPVVTPTDNEDEFRENAALAASIPDADTDSGRFAILLEAVPAGEFGRALLAGVTAVKLQVADADHGFADVTDGDASKLTTADAGGAQILWKEAGTGTKWGLVRLGSPAGGASAIPVKLTASQSSGSYTGREQAWTGSDWSDKPEAPNITCVNLSETTGGCTSCLDLAPEPVVLVTPISGAYFFERETNAKYKA